MAKFLIGSHSHLIYNNMIIKQQINRGTVEKLCHLYNGIFPSIHLCHTLSIYSVTSPVLFTENNKLWNEKKEDFLYIWPLQSIKLYQRR